MVFNHGKQIQEEKKSLEVHITTMNKDRIVTIICSIILIAFICWRLVPYLKSERDKKYKETTRQYEIQTRQNSYNKRKEEIMEKYLSITRKNKSIYF